MILVLVDVIALLTYRKMYKSWNNPGMFAILSWLFLHIVLMTNVQDYGYMPRYYTAYGFYVAVFFLASTISNTRIKNKDDLWSQYVKIEIASPKRINRIINILMLIAGASVLLSARQAGISSIRNLLDYSTLISVRTGIFSGQIHYNIILQMGRYLVFVLVFQYIFFFENLKHKMIKGAFTAGIVLLFDATQFSRTGMTISFIIIVVVILNKGMVFNVQITKDQLLKLGGISVAFVFIFVLFQTIRSAQSTNIFEQLGKVYRILYTYVTCGVPGFDYVVTVDKTQPLYFGLATFDGILDRMREIVSYEILPPISQANFYTGFREFYLDFREFGFIIYPALLGVVTTVLYYRAKNKKRMPSFVLLSYTEMFLLFLIIAPMSAFQYYFYTLVINLGLLWGLRATRNIEIVYDIKALGLSN